MKQKDVIVTFFSVWDSDSFVELEEFELCVQSADMEDLKNLIRLFTYPQSQSPVMMLDRLEISHSCHLPHLRVVTLHSPKEGVFRALVDMIDSRWTVKENIDIEDPSTGLLSVTLSHQP
jgi:hypothetical protein